MFTVITTYEEFGTGNLIIKTETVDDGRAAREAFCIYIADPDCAACVVMDNRMGMCTLRYDQDRFDFV